MIDTLFAFFAHSWVPWGLSGALVLGAFAIWLDFRRRLQPVLAGIEEALAIIEDAASPAAFRDRFPTIDAALAANPIIGEAWRTFARTLVPVPGQDAVLGATRRPAEDLNEAVLASAGLNLRFYMAVPNYLVGLGLLFTFLGLVAALYFASAGVAAANVQEAQGALRDLLSAATFKFATSIAGLGASIAYSSGLSGTPMPDYADATRDETQRWDLVAFVLSLRAPSKPAASSGGFRAGSSCAPAPPSRPQCASPTPPSGGGGRSSTSVTRSRTASRRRAATRA